MATDPTPDAAHLSEAWRRLVAGAVLGTERQPPALGGIEGALGELLTELQSRDPESALLGAAAAMALHRRAGQLPATDDSPLAPPAPPEELKPCSPRAAQHLTLLLGGQYREVLPEWLNAAAQRRLRVPFAALPALLDRGRTDSALRPLVLPVLGARGGWLAAQNSDWQYAAQTVASTDPLERWQLGETHERVAALEELRALDPPRAREMLAQNWEQETPDDRAQFIEVLRASLSLVDEPFLETALDDRRKEVRRAAQSLLSRLPESQLVQRMQERVLPLLAYTPGKLLRKARLEVALPEACDKPMVRDGIEPKPPHGIGERAWWLQQMLANVPPQFWCNAWQATPTDLVQAARGEWENVLIDGWSAAAVRHEDSAWLRALLPRLAAEPGSAGSTHWRRVVLEALPDALRDDFIVQMLTANEGDLTSTHPALPVLQQHRAPWSRELTRAVVDRARGRAGADKYDFQIDYGLQTGLPQFALFMPPAALQEVARGWHEQAGAWKTWEKSVTQMLATLQFRHEMIAALDEPT